MCSGRSTAVDSRTAGFGASSRITCAFVPLNPNELTPAIFRPSGHERSAVGTVTGSSSHAMCGLGFSK